MTKVVNLTPHALNVIDDAGVVHTFAPSGAIARVATTRDSLPPVAGLPVSRATFGDVQGLPDPADDTIFVVSGMVLAALKGARSDVFAPGDLVRDDKGQPVGCKGLTAG